jgi:hypothetical protein
VTAWSAQEPAPSQTLSEADFDVPIGDRYFEDYQEGAAHEYGYATVDRGPLRPEDRLRLRTTTIKTRRSRSNPCGRPRKADGAHRPRWSTDARPLCIRGHRAWYTDGADKPTDGGGGNGYADR